MPSNQSAYGLTATILAVKTFPRAFTVEEWADDVEPLEIGETVVAGHKMMADGTMYTFDIASAIPVDIAVLAGSRSDENLSALLKAGTAGVNFMGIKENVIMTIRNPGKPTVVFSGGSIVSGPMAPSAVKEGRYRSNVYKFVFAGVASSSPRGLLSLASGIAERVFS